MAVKEKIKSHPHVVDYFKERPFYKKKIKKPRVKSFKKIVFSELPVYEEVNVKKNKSYV